MIRKFSWTSLVFAAILASGCGGGGSSVTPGGNPTPPPTTVDAIKALVSDIDKAEEAETLVPLIVTAPSTNPFFDTRLGLWGRFEEQQDGDQHTAHIHYFSDEQLTNTAGELNSTLTHFPGNLGFFSVSHLNITSGTYAGTNGSTDAHESAAQQVDTAEVNVEIPALGDVEAVYGHDVDTSIKLTKPGGTVWSSFKSPKDNGTAFQEWESSTGLKIRLDREGETNVMKGTITGPLADLPATVETTIGSNVWQVTFQDGAKSTITVR